MFWFSGTQCHVGVSDSDHYYARHNDHKHTMHFMYHCGNNKLLSDCTFAVSVLTMNNSTRYLGGELYSLLVT